MSLPLAAMDTILKKAGAERVSEEAKQALREVLEKLTEQVAVKAITFSSHAGRKTVKAEDIELAIKQLSS